VQHEKIDDTTDKTLTPCSGCSSDSKEVVANNIETVALSSSSLNKSEYFYEFWREYPHSQNSLGSGDTRTVKTSRESI